MKAADQYLFLIGNLLNADTRSKPTQRFIGTQKRFSMMKRRRKYGPTRLTSAITLSGLFPVLRAIVRTNTKR